eukprot:Rhum_TRINITY_DN14529_c10_g1::Rhum_TRINITY_DN14529_c10_g1_i2::g.96877::m.96877
MTIRHIAHALGPPGGGAAPPCHPPGSRCVASNDCTWLRSVPSVGTPPSAAGGGCAVAAYRGGATRDSSVLRSSSCAASSVAFSCCSASIRAFSSADSAAAAWISAVDSALIASRRDIRWPTSGTGDTAPPPPAAAAGGTAGDRPLGDSRRPLCTSELSPASIVFAVSTLCCSTAAWLRAASLSCSSRRTCARMSSGTPPACACANGGGDAPPNSGGPFCLAAAMTGSSTSATVCERLGASKMFTCLSTPARAVTVSVRSASRSARRCARYASYTCCSSRLRCTSAARRRFTSRFSSPRCGLTIRSSVRRMGGAPSTASCRVSARRCGLTAPDAAAAPDATIGGGANSTAPEVKAGGRAGERDIVEGERGGEGEGEGRVPFFVGLTSGWGEGGGRVGHRPRVYVS